MQDVDQLNVIHVAGTNGKGSTCAYIDQLLAFCRDKSGRPLKIGLYTSPHLTSVCERFRIDGAVLSEEAFAKYFFEVYNIFKTSPREKPPGYFRFLTLLSFYIFFKEGINAAIIETGVGGEFDPTNIVQNPIMTIITKISIDHRIRLGKSLGDIAWHKAGILKSGCPAISVKQEVSAKTVLETRAREKGVKLQFADDDDERLIEVKLAPIQKTNASAALHGTEIFLNKIYGCESLSPEAVQTLGKTVWPGRYDVRTEGHTEWRIDGAHNEEALKKAADWFSDIVAATDL